MKKPLTLFVVACALIAFSSMALAAKPAGKSKFYDFSDQLIDGEIKKPTALYTDARQQGYFEVGKKRLDRVLEVDGALVLRHGVQQRLDQPAVELFGKEVAHEEGQRHSHDAMDDPLAQLFEMFGKRKLLLVHQPFCDVGTRTARPTFST